AIGWNSIQLSLGFIEYNLCDISKSTDREQGNYSLQMKPKPLSSTIASYLNIQQFNVPAVLTNARIDVNTLVSSASSLANFADNDLSDWMQMLETFRGLLSDGLLIDGKPESIEGYYNLTTESAGDVFVVLAYSTATTEDTSVIVGAGIFYDRQPTGGFVHFSVPMNYFSDNDANELYFVALMLNADNSATELGNVKIDDININYSAELSISPADRTEEKIFLYPNPTDGTPFRINGVEHKSIEICDPVGRVVKRIDNYSSDQNISLNDKGLFFVRVGKGQMKLIVK
ncbi:MAG: T9SS type A sorting domain-containing protein, partial [Bacteroidales bacterium]|nr:T9SS type A sorting domain-containing protein [Bacteroidales bacterium]